MRNLCVMTAVVLRNLAAPAAKQNSVAAHFQIPSVAPSLSLLSFGAFPISFLLAFLSPPTGWDLACVSLCKGWQS